MGGGVSSERVGGGGIQWEGRWGGGYPVRG